MPPAIVRKRAVGGRFEKLADSGSNSRTFPFVFSTATVDFDREIVEQSWDLTRYNANPVVLLEHERGAGWFGSDITLPIGKASNVRVENGELKGDITFASEKANPIAEQVCQLVREGILNAVSVGFRAGDIVEERVDGVDRVKLKNNELFEVSIVSLPSNPEAVAERDAKLLEALKSVLSKSTNVTNAPEGAKGPTMNEILLKLLGLAADAKPEDVSTAIKALQATAGLGAKAAELLGTDATEGAIAKRVADLLSTEAKAAELGAEVVKLKDAAAKRDESDAERDVAWVIKCGERGTHGVQVNSASKRALLALRKSAPSDFAEDFKVALEGLKAFDALETFGKAAGLEAPAPAPASPSPKSLDEQAEDLRQQLAAKGQHITRTEALQRVRAGA